MSLAILFHFSFIIFHFSKLFFHYSFFAASCKVDRESARLSGEVENELFDLFVQLGADDEQMEYSTLYASGKQGRV